MTERIIQRTVFAVESDLRNLYFRIVDQDDQPILEPPVNDRFSLELRQGWKLSTDAYFNTFFEAYWRKYTHVSGLSLRLSLSGVGSVRLIRRSASVGPIVVARAEFSSEWAKVSLEIPAPTPDSRADELLHFEISARSERLLLRKAEWRCDGAEASPVRLVVGCCTFNREQYLLENVVALFEDAAVAAVIERVVVVDQGFSKVRRHHNFYRASRKAGIKLRVVEQDNFGGAGGFTRAILEARDEARATHVLLMDDDVVVEPESVFRAAAFLSLARADLAVGAPMLDMLRRNEVYDAGGWVDPVRLRVATPVRRRAVDSVESLPPLGEVVETDYNAWWFFAFPLHLIDRHGLPLPIFIRGDDCEFGYRLSQGGNPTVTLPGIGVWHEPFYLKTGGWHAYYDMRNMLILAAVHRPRAAWRTAVAFIQHLGHKLLLLDYLGAELLCAAMADFCLGPETLAAHPRTIHSKVVALHRSRPQQWTPRARPLAVRAAGPARRLQLATALHLSRCVLHQLLPADAAAEPREKIAQEDADWLAIGAADVIAVDGWDEDRFQVLRRSRSTFFRLAARGLALLVRLCIRRRNVGDGWRAAFSELCSIEFWRRYLDVDEETPASAAPAQRYKIAA